jgi:hypothetical protein
MTKTGSLAPLPIYWPGPTFRSTTVPEIGEKMGVAALMIPFLEVGNFAGRLAENTKAAARSFQRDFC